MALSIPPLQTPLIDQHPLARGRVSRQWAPWFDALVRAVRGYAAAVTWDPPAVTSGTAATTTVTIPGATLGDYVSVSFSLSLAFCILSGYVSSADTVTVVLFNSTISTVNLGSGTLRVLVRPGTL